MTKNFESYKFYLSDTGLFVTLMFIDRPVIENNVYAKLLSDKLSANLGYLYENLVAQMITATGRELYYHTWEKLVVRIIMKWISWSGRKFAIKTILSDVIFDVALFLVVVNWFDGIVIDRWWVGHGRIWKIKGMEDMSFVKSWKTVLVNRSLATLMYLVLSFVVAGIVVGIGKII